MRHPVDTDLWNEDLAPTSAAQRSWRWYHFAALWVGMVMCIPAYTLSASLVEGGMSAGQAVFTVFLANAIVLLPMLAIGHAGTKYGIPYAVLARAAFGTRGARLPALMRAIVACGWYGIQTWFGGSMIYTLLGVLMGHPIGGDKLGALGINGAQLGCFLAFWAIQFWFIVHGMDSIRKLETWTAPLKIAICFVLLGWAYEKAGGFGPLLAAPSQFVEGGKKAGQVLDHILAVADGDGGLLGHAGAEHPRLHPLRAQPARPASRPVGWPAGADGPARRAGRHRHLGHRGPVRQGAVGTRSTWPAA